MPDDLNTRVERLEEAERRAWAAIERVADKQDRLDDVLVTLTESQVALNHQVTILSRETDRRIADLVSAIGELIRNRNGGK
jgi:hypothetical protein